jgi:hypothetical protein
MEFLVAICVIWFLFTIIKESFPDKKNRQNPSNSRNTQSTRTPVSRPLRDTPKKQNTQTFRPSARNTNNTSISFKTTTSVSSTSNVPAAADLDGLHDAFTGAPLSKALGLHQCQNCKVYYHTESLQILREANASQCVACQSTNIIAVITGNKAAGGKDYTPNVITLENYQEHVGSVVTFEGRVSRVNTSRRGTDFAVMFENKSWVKGFKLVFFPSAVSKVGGAAYINSLAGKRVRVRGLVIKHATFGYEIIVSEKSMLLSVES